MPDPTLSLPRLGILGGGQLAKMLLQEAGKLSLDVTVLDPSPDCPAAPLAKHVVVGGYHDAAAIRDLAGHCDVLTYDLEHVDTAELAALEAQGLKVFPSPASMAQVQDKLVQRQVMEKAGLPIPAYAQLTGAREAAFAAFGYPLVQKTRRAGYDGKGVAVIKSAADLTKALPPEGCLLERCVDLEAELAVMVVRAQDGEMRSFPAVRMVMDPRANLLDALQVPAGLTPALEAEAKALAERVAEAFKIVGVVGVELFLDKAGKLLVNELAPRPHNSGHYTIEACASSQYSQHLRAILGLPLGDPRLLSPAATVNLLGGPEGVGPTRVRGLAEALAVPGVHIHLYGKAETRPFRKMGHLTALAETPQAALERALKARDAIRILPEQA
jgi:5-(carboxyamino)imidazole ribonucleotide synthase